jgi:hypothetical protein
MKREYYSSTIKEFKLADPEWIWGQLLINDEFETTDLQKNAWRDEITIMKRQLSEITRGEIAFEYTIPRVGHRVDIVLIIDGTIFLLEFKVGDRDYKKTTDDQVMDYALDLKYFHEASNNKYIIPINVSTEAELTDPELVIMEDGISEVLHCNKHNVGRSIQMILDQLPIESLTMEEWINSRYAPTPTIIEAAQALYRNHSVEEISRKEAGAENLSETTDAINRVIDECKSKKKKAICFVTGVPGAGKTLAGLNIANERHKFEADEHAVFLSGNGPLVDVLQEALARDKASRDGITKNAARRETKAFIQIIHKFRDEALTTEQPPIEKVTIFDEAQRAWDEKQLSDFMHRKKGVAEFNQSEPEFLISIMDRHQDWATIICLVGGGQEIYTGEAGIEDWFKALNKGYDQWEIYLSDKMVDYEYVGDSSIKQLLGNRNYKVEPSLHLSVSLRSFRSEKLSDFIKALLDNDPQKARSIYNALNQLYPIVITRSFEKAKEWVKEKARGNERYGLLASSEGKRLRGVGIWVPSEINHVGWFLNGKDNVDSSYYLEVAASEFKVQGLEIDYGLLAWDADFRYENGQFGYYRFRGTSWNNINIDRRRQYLKNAYRVLLTRARQGLVIYVPEGDPEDTSRKKEYYDGTYEYLKQIGIEEF